MAETLALHFAFLADNVGATVRPNDYPKTILVTTQVSPRLAQNFHKEQTIALELTNETQVQCALKSLKTNKAAGHDFIPAKTLKLGAHNQLRR